MTGGESQLDQRLLEAFLGGDQLAFEQWVILHRKSAVLFALRLTQNVAVAEDAVQDAFAWVLIHPERIRPEHGLKPLLYTLVRRRCMDWFRKVSRQVSLDELCETAQYEPEAVYVGEEALWLHQALNRLHPRYGRVLHLLDLEGFTQQEVAQILGTTPGAVKVLHHRAKRRLKAMLEEEEIP